MAVKEILKLGDRDLYQVSEPCYENEQELIEQTIRDLHDTLFDFRAKYDAGRAIAAPQIGVQKRMIYMHVGSPVVFMNPVLINKSSEMMEVWDDCPCFPNLLVKVLRHQRCTIRYQDQFWNACSMELEGDFSELLQHEYDHLEGILATERAVSKRAYRWRG